MRNLIALLALACVAWAQYPTDLPAEQVPIERIGVVGEKPSLEQLFEKHGMLPTRFWTVWQWEARVSHIIAANDFHPSVTVPLALSVIAKESNGYSSAIDETGLGDSVGLMQVIPQTWLPCYQKLTSKNATWEYNCQIYTGLWMLSSIIKKTDGDVRYALAAYNCGFVSVDAGKCYPWGGYTYADNVLENIYPVFLGASELDL